MFKIILDTNIYISALFFRGNPREILNHIISEKSKIFISPDILNEIFNVLQRRKFGLSLKAARNIIAEIETITETVFPVKKHKVVVKDSNDNIIIDCAIEAKADYIITGDTDLLDLQEYKKIKIINPADFLSFINK